MFELILYHFLLSTGMLWWRGQRLLEIFLGASFLQSVSEQQTMSMHCKQGTYVPEREKEATLISLTWLCFPPFIEKVSCFTLAHFHILLLVQGWTGRKEGQHTQKHTSTHSFCLTPDMAKSCPIHFPSIGRKKCVRNWPNMFHESALVTQRNSNSQALMQYIWIYSFAFDIFLMIK